MNQDKNITTNQAIEKSLFEDLVLVTGTFDILHLGHLRFLNFAKGEKNNTRQLLVIVLSDEQVKRRKGQNRPYFSQQERVEALSYLESVDYILPWSTDWEKLRDFVLELRPKYLAVVEEDEGLENKRVHIEKAGGELLVFKRQGDYSSSNLARKLLEEELS